MNCGRVRINKLLRKTVKSYRLQPCLSKLETNHDENYGVTWEIIENELLPYLKSDILSTVFCYARYQKGMEELTGLDMKN